MSRWRIHVEGVPPVGDGVARDKPKAARGLGRDWWGALDCGLDWYSVRLHGGRRGASAQGCRSSWCLRCQAQRKAIALGPVEVYRQPAGEVWYLVTLTPDKPCGDLDQVDVFRKQVELFARTLTDRKLWSAGAGVLEVAWGHGDREQSWVRCPVRATPVFVEGVGDGLSPKASSKRVAMTMACRAGRCPLKCSEGRLPVGHVHAHLVVSSRVLWYGRESLKELAVFAETGELPQHRRGRAPTLVGPADLDALSWAAGILGDGCKGGGRDRGPRAPGRCGTSPVGLEGQGIPEEPPRCG